MPKMDLIYGVNMNVKITPEMSRLLRAAGYFRGERGRYAGIARDLLQVGLDRFIQSLSEGERRRFDEILASVTRSDTLR